MDTGRFLELLVQPPWPNQRTLHLPTDYLKAAAEDGDSWCHPLASSRSHEQAYAPAQSTQKKSVLELIGAYVSHGCCYLV